MLNMSAQDSLGVIEPKSQRKLVQLLKAISFGNSS